MAGIPARRDGSALTSGPGALPAPPRNHEDANVPRA